VTPGSNPIDTAHAPRAESGAAKDDDALRSLHNLDNREFLSQLLWALEALHGQAIRRSLPMVAWALALAAKQVQRDLAADLDCQAEDAPDKAWTVTGESHR
jgi:hypothetical protein